MSTAHTISTTAQPPAGSTPFGQIRGRSGIRPEALDQPAASALTGQTAKRAATASNSGTAGLVIFDPGVPHHEQLVAGLVSGLDVVLLDPRLAAIPQISAALSRSKDLHSLHLVCHGQPGQLHLAGSVLDAAFVKRHGSDLRHWRKAFHPDADLLVYGCEAGAGLAGEALMRSLAHFTGLGVAASSTKVGNAELGGGWEFDRSTRPITAPVAFTAELQTTYSSVLASLINGLGGSAGFGENTLGRNDDSSSNFINLAPVFESGINFFGTIYTGFYINNNGNITFGSSSSAFVPFQITGNLTLPIIAPFFTDIDTRRGALAPSPGGTSTGSNLVYWDLDPVGDIVTITWDDVGEFSNGSEPNAFQLRLQDLGSGNFNIEIRYEDIRWFRGNARAGYSADDGENFFELPQSGTSAMLSLEAGSNVGDPGVFVFSVLNGPIVSSTTANGSYGAGALITLTVRFPETVLVTGNPRLQLETGAIDRFATYTSGSGTNTLSFSYTVQPGDSSADLDLLSANALTLNGGTIKGAAGNDMSLRLPAPGSAASLAGRKSLVVAGGAPLITTGPTAISAAGFTLSTNVATTAALRKADNSLIFSTPLPATTSTLLTVAAQAAVTATSLVVTDLVGQQTTSATRVWLGTNAADLITGSASADLLFGFGGADTLTGSDGNDSYTIESSSDLVVETNASAGGIDRVVSSLGEYTLTDNVEHLFLATGAIDGTGNSLNNIITGNAGANRLDGADGIDTLNGGDGNDAYIIETVGDLVVETNAVAATGGTDTVLSSLATYTLTANIENLTLTGAASINGTGNALNNRITGNAAANVLNGGAGSDTLAGGDGNDAYVIETAGDLVVETNANAAIGGIDRVLSSLTNYTLTANVENLILIGAAIEGRGNNRNNIIRGNAGANNLNGAGGADTLTGGDGSDTYTISSSDDLVVETNANPVSGGIDRVISILTTYALTANVEDLILKGTGYNGTGNNLDNRITGNAASNILIGGSGNDTLTGANGTDFYFVDAFGDLVVETNPDAATGGIDRVLSSLARYTLTPHVENLTLIGNAAINGTGNRLNNVMVGNAAANVLNGVDGNDTLASGAGNDTLAGGLAADTFRFDSLLNATTNRDRITDFSLVEGDRIELENSVFTSFTTTGTLADSAFSTGASATTADHRILYNTTTGLLAFDSDGTGAATAIAFATLSPGLALTNASFTVT